MQICQSKAISEQIEIDLVALLSSSEIEISSLL